MENFPRSQIIHASSNLESPTDQVTGANTSGWTFVIHAVVWPPQRLLWVIRKHRAVFYKYRNKLSLFCCWHYDEITTLAIWWQHRRLGVAAINLCSLKTRMSQISLGIHVRTGINNPYSTARLRSIRISIATVYVMIRVDINIIMLLWRYFVISKHHTNILQSLTTILRQFTVDANTITIIVNPQQPSPHFLLYHVLQNERRRKKVPQEKSAVFMISHLAEEKTSLFYVVRF